VNYQDELYNLAREIDTAVATVAQTTSGAERAPLEWRLPGELGSVTVSGAGELTAVTLDATEMHQYSADALARTLLHGIRDAEQRADRQRGDTVAAAVTETGLA
jgi:DNA-binding protein YbaB